MLRSLVGSEMCIRDSRKTNGTQHAYVHTYFDTYSDQHVLYCSVLCCAMQCFAVLCSALLFSRFNDIHARTYCGTAVCCCIPGTHRSRIFVAVQIATENERQQWKIKTAAAQNARGHICRLWPTLMLANVVIWCARKR